MNNYQVIEKIEESTNSLVYRGSLYPDHRPVILKILRDRYPSVAKLTRYKQEYEITRSLNSDRVIKAYGLQRYENSLIMFLEDFNGKSIKKIMTEHRFNLEEFLNIAIKITEGIAIIHAANIIHKDINLSNIVYNPETKQLKLIDFGISSRLSQENLAVIDPGQLEGTLAYIAPEQTGRMNRGIDYRCDFYSLGVSLYELLTSRLPFETTDPMELVHCHIAQEPDSPHELVPDIPPILSDIILKLLAKTPEDRYQTAWGIKVDLETCLERLQTVNALSPFTLGSQDVSEKLYISQKLYGREIEIDRLLNAFDRVSQGSMEIILISGYSGSGKSALVNEIHKPITGKRGYFITGKFDQFKRDIPYSAISQAFQDLIRQLLSEPDAILQDWKTKILEELRYNGQILIDIIPDLEKVIGEQPTVEPLGIVETQNRFHLFFKRFIRIFCKAQHPLVIFLDDLQWADLASLNLIEQLLLDRGNQHLLMIGTYRDNEITLTHPLIQTLETIEKSSVSIERIALPPLNTALVNELISDTLNCSPDISKPLAELVFAKTAGNPFFTTQLLYSLHQQQLLLFNRSLASSDGEGNPRGYWHWDMARIENMAITDNVVDLMVDKIVQLQETTRNVLKIAACIGNYFNLEILATVNKQSQVLTARELQPAIDEGLIVPLDNRYKIPLLFNSLEQLSKEEDDLTAEYPEEIPYKFLHDRVQQAAYLLIPEEEKKQIHLQIGRLLQEKIAENELEDHIFNIVNQLNKSSSLISRQSEKNKLAKLNLFAGKKAKTSTAYTSALLYFETGIDMLAVNSWDKQYDLTMELHLETLEALYLNTQFDRVESLAQTIVRFSKKIHETIKVYQIKSLLYYVQLQSSKAIDTNREALAKLGVDLPIDPGDIGKAIQQKQATINSLLDRKSILDLADLPPMQDNHELLVMSILQSLISPTLTTNFPLFFLVLLKQINRCLEYGNPPRSMIVYSYYGMVLCANTESIDLGYQFGNLAIKLLENKQDFQAEPVVFHLYYGFIWHWKNRFKDLSVERELRQVFQRGIEAGNYEFANYIAITYCFLQFFGGYDLEEVDRSYRKYIQAIGETRQEYSIFYITISSNVVTNLRSDTTSLLVMGSSPEEEEKYLETLKRDNSEWLLFLFYFSKMVVCYFFSENNRAYEYGILADRYVISSGAYLPAPQHNFYFSLSILSNYENRDLEQKNNLITTLENNQERMKKWAEHCPENFQHKYDLVEAEKRKALGEIWQAEELYEKAIQGAKKYDFIQEEAIAYERAAEFYLSLGREEIGQLYMRNAHHCYARWGAVAKIKQLEEEYSQYLIGINSDSKNKSVGTDVSTTGNDGEVLDLTTIIKASQAISGEIQLETLLQKLMKITIENAGARQGFLILENESGWAIEARGTVDSEEVTTLQSLSIDSPDPVSRIPILPTSIIYYVARTREPIVLSDALTEGQFGNDPYIIATEPKSILCTPLLDRGQLKGIVYLENNLTTGAFTPDRVELLNILSAQIAISIENSRLYQTLERKVEERTRELSQTLQDLEATQQKLIFENKRLKTLETPDSFDYQVGGSLAGDAPTYVFRAADIDLYSYLKQGNFCYVLNSRQMGKSSLMVNIMTRLQREGYRCAAIDLTLIGTEEITVEQWYKGIAVNLLRNFGSIRRLSAFKTWWNERLDLSPVQRLSHFIEEFLLEENTDREENQPKKSIIFIDEIDSVSGLPFPVTDFFTMMRSFYNQRAIDPASRLQDLTFAVFGVATPSELIADHQKTPFNIGKAIELESFQEHEARPLLFGLEDKVSSPRLFLEAVLRWTGGQPFLTQKLCQLVRHHDVPIPDNKELQWLDNLVRQQILDSWEARDQPEHLRTIRDRLLRSPNRGQLLELYRQILERGEIELTDSALKRELRLSGLVVRRDGKLKVHNRIYETIFNLAWVNSSLDSPFNPR